MVHDDTLQFTPEEIHANRLLEARIRQSSREDAQELAIAKEAREHTERLVNRARWMFGAVVTLCAACVTGGIWTARLQARVERAEERSRESAAALTGLMVKDNADDRLIQNIQNSVDGNRKERVAAFEVMAANIARIDKVVMEDHQKVTRMDIMRELGRSNKEDFQERKGYPAPNPNMP